MGRAGAKTRRRGGKRKIRGSHRRTLRSGQTLRGGLFGAKSKASNAKRVEALINQLRQYTDALAKCEAENRELRAQLAQRHTRRATDRLPSLPRTSRGIRGVTPSISSHGSAAAAAAPPMPNDPEYQTPPAAQAAARVYDEPREPIPAPVPGRFHGAHRLAVDQHRNPRHRSSQV